ncbi:MAG: tRNA (uridine(34)/cytosine(34)/5-carboxymethylaminomethyluridine(34)-2'-O)-methyltransferase TrmL [Thermoplasmata archaeon]|nr:MAG: tRNA (uridine(34)/cytosine(34)/5-carboxymethylaminomethyluridine(34)-2'-O)-methyltransferase TrmL [Thermoplasmata archaeon]
MAFNECKELPHRVIQDPVLHIVLFQPEIPSNTGNIARLCGAAELRLHLIHPLGFRVDDRHLKRAGLDYWGEVDIRYHQSFEAFSTQRLPESKLFAFSAHAQEIYTNAHPGKGDCLIFGRETGGLPQEILEAFPSYRVPIWGKARSLHLATTVGIVAYHFLHQLGEF